MAGSVPGRAARLSEQVDLREQRRREENDVQVVFHRIRFHFRSLYLAEQADGFQPAESFCFLKCVLVQKGAAEVHRIVHLGGHQQQGIAVGYVEAVEVFGNDGVFAVGNSVLSQISGLHFAWSPLSKRRPFPDRRALPKAETSSRHDRAGHVPTGRRNTLPVSALSLWRAEVKGSGLGACVELGF